MHRLHISSDFNLIGVGVGGGGGVGVGVGGVGLLKVFTEENVEKVEKCWKSWKISKNFNA